SSVTNARAAKSAFIIPLHVDGRLSVVPAIAGGRRPVPCSYSRDRLVAISGWTIFWDRLHKPTIDALILRFRTAVKSRWLHTRRENRACGIVWAIRYPVR